MSTFEDRLLGEKLQYYCSSSEDEDDDKLTSTQENQSTLGSNVSHWTGTSQNTGPKGVVQDWQLYKKLEAEKREENEKHRIELMKKLSITTTSHREDEERKKNEDLEAELAELMSDDFLKEFQKKRMIEMMSACGETEKFGKVIELTSQTEYLNAIEDENKNTTIIVHIYEKHIPACVTLNNCLNVLASDYCFVKFCKITCTIAGLSKKFKNEALPALLVYRNKQLIGNFIRIQDELNDDFFPSDLESLLVEKGIIPEKSLFVK